MKKTIEIQRAELQAKLVQLDQKVQAQAAAERERSERVLTKVFAAAAKKFGVDFGKVDQAVFKNELVLFFQKLKTEAADSGFVTGAKSLDAEAVTGV